jgi:hypothetical protein
MSSSLAKSTAAFLPLSSGIFLGDIRDSLRLALGLPSLTLLARILEIATAVARTFSSDGSGKLSEKDGGRKL